MNFINKIRSWLSAARRQALYTSVAAISPILVTLGFISGDDVQHILTLTAAGLQGFAGLLALLNLTRKAASSWFITAGRGVIYAMAATMAPAAVALGLLTEAASVNTLTGLSLGMTALAALLGVINLTSTPNTGGLLNLNTEADEALIPLSGSVLDRIRNELSK